MGLSESRGQALIPPGWAAKLSAQLAATRPTQIVVKRSQAVSDGAGGRTDAVTTIGTYPARVARASNTTALQGIAGQAEDSVVWAVAFDPSADVQTEDQLTLPSGATMRATAVITRASYQPELVVFAYEEE